MTCDLRTLDYKRNLTLEHQAELGRATKLDLSCSDVFFFESNLRSDHFGSLLELRELNIEYCKIRTLPPRSFVGLSNLEVLSIQSFNSEWSAILLDIDYEAFVGLDRLKSIKLSNNNIFKTPVKLFCPLSNIETIDLRNNRLVNLEDLGLSNRTKEQCPVSVTKLDVRSNKLQSLTPGSLASTYRLESIIASDNEVAVLDRTAFRSLTLLRTIDLGNNKLAALPPDLFLDNTDLQEINLANNSIGTIHLSVFRNLSKLERLNLSHNHLDENWIKEDMFADLGNLTELDLSHNHLSNIDNNLFQELKLLTYLNLSNNRLHTLGSQVLMSLSRLSTLLLSHNQLETVAQLAISSSPQLKILSLDNNKLQSLHQDIFRNLTNLRNLTVSRNLLSDLPHSLADLTNLVHLDVSINIVGVIGREDIQGLHNLTFLNLSSNDISRIDAATFNETPSLHYLDLSKNRLQTLDQSSFAALGNLTYLNLAENQIKDINGLLTTQMKLEHLNISSNKLHWFDYAFVPNSLKSLDIHDNQIDSVENYYSLRDGFQLEFLDASRNRIRALGVLSLLPSLKTIILKNNKISDIGHNTFLNKDNLTDVDLRGNQLSVLNLASLAVSKTLKNDKPSFLMSENPFQCSCQMQWLVNPGHSERLPNMADLDEAECLVNYHGNNTAVAKLTSVPPNQFLCQYDSHCFSLCMCCDFFGCDCRMQCPDGCSCFHDSTWSSNIIQCSARGHSEVPALIPMDATSVFLDGNSMRDLSGQIFLGRSRMKNLYLNNSRLTEVSNNTFVGLLDLQLLDLSNNMLQIFRGQEFTDLVNLRELYLQNNKILHISEEAFRPLKSLSVLRLDNNLLTTFPIWELASNPFLIGMYIANNVWTCDCEFVSKFRMFIDGNLDKVIDARDVKCIVNNLIDGSYSQSGRNCIESTNAAYRTQSPTDIGALYIIVGCCIMFLAVIFIIFAMYKMQDSLKLWVHAKYGIRIPTKNIPTNNSDKLFDAYFSYCLKDDQVVVQGMAQELTGYRLCLHHRDLVGNSRNSTDSVVSAAKASARTIIVISKAFLASEWDQIKSVLLSPESNDISRNVIIILLEDMFDYELIQNFEVKTFINSSPHVLRWHESKFWTKLRYLLPDPISSSLDKTNTTQLDSTEFWSFSPKEIPDSGVSSAHISQVSLNHAGTKADSLRFKTKSRQSIPSTVESNNEFIYLTPKPKKARCQPGGAAHEDMTTHQRSSSEVYQQQVNSYGTNYHQRSKSTLSPTQYHVLASNQNLHQPMIPMNSNPNSYNQIDDQNQSEKHIYGSTSFIYKLISDPSRSTGPNETPTLPVSSPGNHIYLQNPNNHQRSSSLLTAQQNPNHGSPTQQHLHQRSKSTLSPTNSVQLPPHAQHARSHSHLTSTPQQASPQMPVSQRSKLSRSSSQLNSQRPNPSMQHRSTSTLAPQHRRDSSNPSRNHPHIQQSPSHPNSTLNILQDILQQSPPNQTIHQRSKSTPYHGFVV